MENRAHALAAGLFILILGIAAVAALWWLGQQPDNVDRYVLETRGNVTGLNVQANVRYRGIRAGRVEDITTDARDRRIIVVTISLDSRYKLTRGTTAQLNTQGVTGLAYVQLEDDGSKPELLVGTGGEPPRIALQASLLDTLGDQAGDIATQASQVAVRVSRLLDDRNLRNFSRSLENVAAASEALQELPTVVASLRQVLSDANVRKLSAVLDNLEKTSREAAPLAGEMREMVKTMTVLAGRLDKLGGEAGGELAATTLPRANALMQELSANSHRLSRLLETLERRPQALVFGNGEPAPGPGEAGFAAPGK